MHALSMARTANRRSDKIHWNKQVYAQRVNQMQLDEFLATAYELASVVYSRLHSSNMFYYSFMYIYIYTY